MNIPCFSGRRYFWRSFLSLPIQQLQLKMKDGPFVRSSTVTTTCEFKACKGTVNNFKVSVTLLRFSITCELWFRSILFVSVFQGSLAVAIILIDRSEKPNRQWVSVKPGTVRNSPEQPGTPPEHPGTPRNTKIFSTQIIKNAK